MVNNLIIFYVIEYLHSILAYIILSTFNHKVFLVIIIIIFFYLLGVEQVNKNT